MPGTNLTREEAQHRSATVRTRSYRVEIDVTTSDTQFRTDTTIHFDAEPGADTFVDLIADKVLSISLNGEAVDPGSAYHDSRIHLPALLSSNTLVVSSLQAFTNTGEGLHRFVDPVDGEAYLYSQFEVPDSRRVFAVFEQPDLKATFQFSIIAPSHWKVVSNQATPEASVIVAADGTKNLRFDFAPTPVLSSYITAIVAGPYAEVRSTLQSRDGRIIPLGVFCRSSLSDYLDADYIFDITRKGFAFFEEIFDYPYPFDKYDQLFVPEFNAGAMENAGAITFTEAYVFRSQVTDAMRERRVITILHELAHMWFGDLVTMRWWNDLWLNESFAEYMSTLAVAEATEWTDCWTTFVASEKTWAYRQDQLPSTHPIVADIRDLNDVLVNFDGITYAKGASVLAQLVAWVGREPFMRGVHDYFVKHAHANTELPDLLRELESHSGRDLTIWSKAWLESSGVNTLHLEATTDADGLYTQFSVRQLADESSRILRPHRIHIGFYELVDKALVRTRLIECDIVGELTDIVEPIGEKQPDLVLLNDNDLTYAKIRLDERSLQTAVRYLSNFESSLARSLVWGSLWDQTRDAELSASTFVEIVLKHVAAETNSTMLRTVLSQLLLAARSYVSVERREATLSHVADRLWQLARDAAPASDHQFQFMRAFAATAHTEEQLDTVLRILEEQEVLEGLSVDTDLGWELLISLSAGGRVTQEEIDTALADDLTATGQQSAAHARAAMPNLRDKELAWSTIFDDDSKPNAIVRSTGLGFLRAHDTSVLEPFVPLFFSNLTHIWNTRSHAIVDEIVEGFYPSPLASASLRDATAKWLQENSDAPAALRRLIIEQLAGVERALTAQAFDAEDHV